MLNGVGLGWGWGWGWPVRRLKALDACCLCRAVQCNASRDAKAKVEVVCGDDVSDLLSVCLSVDDYFSGRIYVSLYLWCWGLIVACDRG